MSGILSVHMDRLVAELACRRVQNGPPFGDIYLLSAAHLFEALRQLQPLRGIDQQIADGARQTLAGVIQIEAPAAGRKIDPAFRILQQKL
jgi:hypothetical protein